MQPEYEFVINNDLICKYRADFRYIEIKSVGGVLAAPINTERTVVEDVKGVKTALYRLKKRMMLIFHGIEIRET